MAFMSNTKSTNPRKRSVAVKAMVTEQLHADLVAVAEAMGQTPSTAAAFAIGSWVALQKRHVDIGNKVADSLMASGAEVLKEQMSFLGKGKA